MNRSNASMFGPRTGAVHAIKWAVQTRYMQVEPMTELPATGEADRPQITAEAA